MFDTRYMEQYLALETIFNRRFGSILNITEKYGPWFKTTSRQGWFGYRWVKYIASGGESEVIAPPYSTLSTGTTAISKITNNDCPAVEQLRKSYNLLNQYQKTRMARTGGSGDTFDATNFLSELLKDLFAFLSTQDDKALAAALKQTQLFINDVLTHDGRGDGKGLYPTAQNIVYNTTGLLGNDFTLRDALGGVYAQLKAAEGYIALAAKEAEMLDHFKQVKILNKALLSLMLTHSTVVLRDIHNKCYLETIDVNSLRDLKKEANQGFIKTDSGMLAHLTVLCPAHKYNFPEDSAGLKSYIDAPMTERMLAEHLEATLLDCSFIKIRRAVEQDDRHKDKQFEIYFTDEPDNFKILFEGNEFPLNLMNGNSGIFKVFAKDRELLKLFRIYYAIQQQISKCQMAIALGSRSKNGESGFRLALDQHTHHLSNILSFYYDTSLKVIKLIVEQCQSVQAAYAQKQSYTPFTRLVKDGKVPGLPYTDGNKFRDDECIVERIDTKIKRPEYEAWSNNYSVLEITENQILDTLDKLKNLVRKIDVICLEGMTEAVQKRINQETKVYTAMARKLADEHNSQDDPDIASRHPDENPNFSLDEIRDLGEIAENAFIMLLAFNLGDVARNKIARQIACRNSIESIAQALLTDPNFRSNPNLVDSDILPDYKKVPIDEYNCLWWILKVYIAGIKPQSNTTIDVQNHFIRGINKTLLSSPRITLEHILLIGCSLASIGGKEAKEKLHLIYDLLKTRAAEYRQSYERTQDERDQPAIRNMLILIYTYRALIGLSTRDRSADKFPLNTNHWCIDTEQSIPALSFCEEETQRKLNQLLENIKIGAGTHMVTLLKRKYHGSAVDRINQMNTLPQPKAKGVGKAPVPPQPKAPPAAAGKQVLSNTILRESSQLNFVEIDEDDPLVHLTNQMRTYIEKSRNGNLTALEANEMAELSKVIKRLKAERMAEASEEQAPQVSRPSSRGGSGQTSRSGSNHATPPSEQVTPLLPPGSQLPPVPPSTFSPPPVAKAPQISEAERTRLAGLAASTGFYPGMFMPQPPSPVPAPTNPTPPVSRTPSEDYLAPAQQVISPLPLTESRGGTRGGYGATRGSPAAAAPTATTLFIQDPNSRSNVFTLNSRRGSEVIPPGTVPASSNSGSSSNLLRLSTRPGGNN